MICKQCGAQIDDNSTECKFCGAVYEQPKPIETEPENEQSGEDNTETLFDENEMKRQRQAERIRAEKQSQLEEIEKRRVEKKKKQQRNKVLAAAAVVVGLSAVGAGGYYVYNRSGNDAPDVAVSTAEPISSIAVNVTAPPVIATVAPAATVEAAVTAQPSWQTTDGGNGSESGETSSSGSGTSGGSEGASGGSSRGSDDSDSSVAANSRSGSSNSAGSSSSSSAGSANRAASSSSASTPKTAAASISGGEYSSSGGLKNGKFVSALVTGSSIVKSGTHSYMSFKYNGATYYANVNADAYTEYVKNQPITISAFPTSEQYNGSVVYEITSMTYYKGSYIFPNSGFELLDKDDVEGMSKDNLALGRNEIYARHGRRFEMDVFKKYFEAQPWYSEDPSYNYDDDESNLNSIEIENVKFIKKYEDAAK